MSAVVERPNRTRRGGSGAGREDFLAFVQSAGSGTASGAAADATTSAVASTPTPGIPGSGSGAVAATTATSVAGSKATNGSSPMSASPPLSTTATVGASGAVPITVPPPIPFTRSVSQGSAARGFPGGIVPSALTRGGSGASLSANGAPSTSWMAHLTIEERQTVRNQIKDAYLTSCAGDFDALLETAVAIQEEMMYAAAPARLDYFKDGFEFENRVHLKRKQLEDHNAKGSSAAKTPSAAASGGGAAAADTAGSGSSAAPAKRARGSL